MSEAERLSHLARRKRLQANTLRRQERDATAGILVEIRGSGPPEGLGRREFEEAFARFTAEPESRERWKALLEAAGVRIRVLFRQDLRRRALTFLGAVSSSGPGGRSVAGPERSPGDCEPGPG